MDVMVYKHHSFLVFTVFFLNFFHKLVYLLPIKVVHVLWADFNPLIFPVSWQESIISLFFVGKPILFMQSHLLLKNILNIIVEPDPFLSSDLAVEGLGPI